MRKPVGLWVVVCAMLVPARALGGETIVIETYVETRAPGTTKLFEPLYGEFLARGWAVGGEVGTRIEERVSRSGEPLAPEQVAEYTSLVDDGYKSWIDGEFSAAIDKLGRAHEMIERKPGTVTQDRRLRDYGLKCLVGLALAHKRLGHAEEATRYMADVYRAFAADRDFNRSLFGPEAHDLYLKVKKELEQAGRGTLRVDVDDEDAVIFLMERYEGLGHITRELVPGRYRVQIRKGTSPGRIRDVEIVAGGEQRLTVSLEFDLALTTRPDFVGLRFASEAEREELQARYATDLARAIGAESVVVLGTAVHEGRRSVVGSVLSLDSGRPYRVGILALEPVEPGTDQLRGLARFLAGGEPGPGIIVPGDRGHETERTLTRPYRTWKWVALGAGVMAFAGGITLWSIDGPQIVEGDRQPRENTTELSGMLLTGAGGALVATGVVLFVLDSRRPAERRFAVTPTSGGVVFTVAGSF